MGKSFLKLIWIIVFVNSCITPTYKGISDYEVSMRKVANVKAKFRLPENVCELESNDPFYISIQEEKQPWIVIEEEYNNQREIVLSLVNDKKYNFYILQQKYKPFRYGCENGGGESKIIELAGIYDAEKKSTTKYKYGSSIFGSMVLFIVNFIVWWPLGLWPASLYESTLPVIEVTEYKSDSNKKSKTKVVEAKSSKGKFKSMVTLKNGEKLTGVEVVVTSDSVVVMTEGGVSTVYKKSEVVSVKK